MKEKNPIRRLCSGVYAQKRTYVYLILPAALLFVVFVIWPFLRGIPYSFYDWDGFSDKMTWVGMKNYLTLFKNKEFYSSLFVTLKFTGISLVFCNLLGLGLALCIYKESRINRLFKTLNFMPFAVSIVLASFVWKYVFGEILARGFGFPAILSDSKWAIVGVTAIQIWRDASYCMILYVAALCNMPTDVLESASIDGASGLGRFFRIELPMIMPAVTTNITLILGWGLITFDYSLAATSGGPGTATQSIALLVYRNIFLYFKAGYGQAMAIILAIATIVITTLIASALRKKEVEL